MRIIERQWIAYRMRLEGKTYREIGDALNVSPSRARQLDYAHFYKFFEPDLLPQLNEMVEQYFKANENRAITSPRACQ